ncbi:MAG: phage major capsid protein [Desulfovibrionaceae bacterium]
MAKDKKDLLQERARLTTEAHAIMEKDDMTSEDEARFDALMAEADKIQERVDRIDRLDAAENSAATAIAFAADLAGVSVDEANAHEAAVAAAFNSFMRGGILALNEDQRGIIFARHQAIPGAVRNAQTTTTTGGGYLIPTGFHNMLTEALLAFGGVRSVATMLPTDGGNPLPMPTVNDMGNKGARVAENVQHSGQDVTFGQVTLNAYTYSSKVVLVPVQLMQDSAFDLTGWLAKALANRLGRITNEEFTTGNGTAQPNGIVTAATLGKTGASGQTTTIIYDDIVDLLHSVDPAYRMSPGCGWMFADSTLKALRKIKDGESRPIWQPGLAGGAPDTILDKPYTINQDMAAMAASAKSILFGDLSLYHIREVKGIHLLRLEERYADYLQVGFLAFQRCDGDLLNAGTNPVKYYQNAAG